MSGSDWAYQVFVSFLIAFPQLTAQPFLIWPWLEGWTWWLWLITFNTGCFLIWHSYYLSCTTLPGSVPPQWQPPYLSTTHHDTGNNGQVNVQVSANTRPRYCAKCEQYKPPRAHHCSQCRRCVLKSTLYQIIGFTN
jgi:palmitoyltransferase ZDHHC6